MECVVGCIESRDALTRYSIVTDKILEFVIFIHTPSFATHTKGAIVATIGIHSRNIGNLILKN